MIVTSWLTSDLLGKPERDPTASHRRTTRQTGLHDVAVNVTIDDVIT
jgi:hypothetical protein